MSYFTGELLDRRIESTKEGVFCTEVISITCPKCKNPTDQVVTATDRTYYGHSFGSSATRWCVVERHKDDIPDPLIYVQLVQGNQENLNISSVPSIW